MTVYINGTTGISGVDGSAGTPALQGNDTNTGISFGSDVIIGSTGGVERFRVDSQGRLGIGTTTASQRLTIETTTSGDGIRLYNNDGTSASFSRVGFQSSNNWDSSSVNAAIDAVKSGGGTATSLRFLTAGDNSTGSAGLTERARIDSSGRLLVGTSTARSNIDSPWGNFTPSVQFESINDGVNGLSVIANASSGYPAQLVLGASRGSSAGSNTIVQTPQRVGQISFQGADGTNLIEAAEIKAEIDGTPGANDMPGRLVFSTTADSASSPTERMRINNAGDVFIGGTGFFLSNSNKGLGIRFSAATSSGGEGGSEIYNSSTSAASAVNPALLIVKGVNEFGSGNRFIQFYANNTTPMGGIVGNGASNVQFASLSDERDKANIEPLVGAAQKIQQLSVVAFDWKNGGGHVDAGFIAQNVETIFPEYVIENVSDGNSEPRKGITGGMSAGYVAVLTAALQEALQKIDAMEARLSALEAQ